MPTPIQYDDFFEDPESSRTYWGKEAAGCIFIAKDSGRILLAKRGEDAEEPGTWGTWGGKIDGDETPKEAVTREVEEETGYDGVFKVSPLYTFKDGQFKYHNFLIVVPFEFTPQLNWENDNSAWVEFGKFPSPLHFGMEALLQHAGPKIKKVIDLLNKKRDTITEMEATPPAIVQSTNSFSKEFVDYIRGVENLGKTGFKNGKWYPYPDAGGYSVGYGHHIKDKGELKRLRNGLSDSAVERALLSDLAIAKRRVYSDIKDMFGVQVPLDTKQEEILVDYAYNLGTLKDFSKFVRAVLTKDWATAAKEHKRFYQHQELGRNKAFFDRYLKENSAPQSEEIKVEKEGLVDVDTYGYRWSTPHSYLSFGHEPNSRSYHLYMIQTPNEADRKQGHSKVLLNKFLQLIGSQGGTLDVESYTMSGMAWTKHVIDRLAKQYRVRLV